MNMMNGAKVVPFGPRNLAQGSCSTIETIENNDQIILCDEKGKNYNESKWQQEEGKDEETSGIRISPSHQWVATPSPSGCESKISVTDQQSENTTLLHGHGQADVNRVNQMEMEQQQTGRRIKMGRLAAEDEKKEELKATAGGEEFALLAASLITIPPQPSSLEGEINALSATGVPQQGGEAKQDNTVESFLFDAQAKVPVQNGGSARQTGGDRWHKLKVLVQATSSNKIFEEEESRLSSGKMWWQKIIMQRRVNRMHAQAMSKQHKIMVKHFNLRKMSSQAHINDLRRTEIREHLLGKRKGRSCSPSKLLKPLETSNNFRRCWETMIIIAVIFQAGYIPFLVSFEPPQEKGGGWATFNTVMDALFIVDLLVMFNCTVQVEQDRIIRDRVGIAREYLRMWFWIDLVSAIPFNLLLSVLGESDDFAALGLLKSFRLPKLLRILKIMRLLKLLKINKVMPDLEWYLSYSSHSNILRLLRLLLAIMIILHYFACIFYSVTFYSWMEWALCEETVCIEHDLWTQYITSYYHSMLLMNGEEIVPQSNIEKVYAVLAILIGAVIVAVIFGNVALAISNLSSQSIAYHEKMSQLHLSMRLLRIPAALKDRIISYYNYTWKEYGVLNGDVETFIPELNKTLAVELQLFLKTPILVELPFFQDCPSSIVQELVLRLQHEIYLRHDYITLSGVTGKEMYVVQRGECEVLVKKAMSFYKVANRQQRANADQTRSKTLLMVANLLQRKGKVGVGIPSPSSEKMPPAPGQLRTGLLSKHPSDEETDLEKVVRALQRGNHFGSVALLMDMKRNTAVRAKTVCELSILKRSDFLEILEGYDDEYTRIKECILRVNFPDNTKADLPAFKNHSTDVPSSKKKSVPSSKMKSVERPFWTTSMPNDRAYKQPSFPPAAGFPDVVHMLMTQAHASQTILNDMKMQLASIQNSIDQREGPSSGSN